MNKLAFIVPTMNRISLLSKLLESIGSQNVQPHQIVIVDGTAEPIEKDLRRKVLLPFDYLHVVPPSLTKQRNAGLLALRPEITLVGYLDDDIVLLPGAMKIMWDFLNNSSDDIAGASFNIVNEPRLISTLPFRIFGIRSKNQGEVLRSGLNTPVYPNAETASSEWLCGGATVWKRTVLESIKYDEWYKGSSYFEDFDFSYQVSRTRKLYVLRDAKVEHNPPPFIPKKGMRLGEMYMTYRYYFVKKHFGRATALFYWASVGLMILNVLSWIKQRKVLYFYTAIGNVIGFFKVITGKIEGIHDQFRASVDNSKPSTQH